MSKNLEDTIKRVLNREVGFLMEKDKERLAKAIAKAIREKYYSVSYN